jgi:hypothetical protein
MNRQEHWENIYATREVTEVSWFQTHPGKSLDLIESDAPDLDSQIIDVGGGASTLVDELLELGYRNISVLDISSNALEKVKRRLGERAAAVR